MSPVVRNHRASTNRTPQSQHVATVATRYVKLDEDTHGWVLVQPESGPKDSLCEYTKVTLVKTQGGRTYFKVVDGWRGVGEIFSMTEENAAKFLVDRPPQITVATLHVKYREKAWENSPFKGHLLQQWASLTVGGQSITVTLNSLWGPYTPIPPGTHKIMSPDASHAGQKTSTEGYRNSLPGRIKANDVWFPIELAGKPGNSTRYVHIGHLSEGCVTVHELEKWNVVYNFLVSRRLPGTQGKYVALLEVSQ